MNIEMLIDKYQLNVSEAQILRYLNKKKPELKQLGIRDVAKETFVSTATIVNMAKKIGFSGYSELVYALLNKRETINEPKSFTLEEKELFIELIKKYQEKHMMILGSGFSQNLANYFSEYLNMYGFRATSNSHLEFLRVNVKQDVLLIIISNSGDTKRLFELATTAKQHEIESIAFLGKKSSKIGSVATLTISTETYSSQEHHDFMPNLFFGTALNQFELLMSQTLKSLFN